MNSEFRECDDVKERVKACYGDWFHHLWYGSFDRANCERETHEYRQCVQDVIWRKRRDNGRERYEGDWVDRAADVARDTVSSLRDKARELKDDWTENLHLDGDRRNNPWDADYEDCNRSHSWSQEYEQTKGRARERLGDVKNRFRDASNDWMDGPSCQRSSEGDWATKSRDQANEWMDRGRGRGRFERNRHDWRERGREEMGDDDYGGYWRSEDRYARNRNQSNDWMDGSHSSSNEFGRRKDEMKERTRAQAHNWSDQAQNAERRMEDRVGELRDRFLHKTEEIGDRVSNAASDLTENMRDKGEELKERFQDNRSRQTRSDLTVKSPQEIKQTLQDRSPEAARKKYSK